MVRAKLVTAVVFSAFFAACAHAEAADEAPEAGRTAGPLEFVLIHVHDVSRNPWKYFQNDKQACPPGIPKDWTEPIDYANGRWHARFVIHRLGNGKYPYDEARLLITLRDNPGKDDAHPHEKLCMFRTTEVGKGVVYAYSHVVKDQFRKRDFSFATQPAAMVRTQPRVHVENDRKCHDVHSRKMAGAWKNAPGAKSYQDVEDWIFPLEYSYQVVVVPAGKEFTGWDNYPLKGATVAGVYVWDVKDLPQVAKAISETKAGAALQAARKLAGQDGKSARRAAEVAGKLTSYFEARVEALRTLAGGDPGAAAWQGERLAEQFAESPEAERIAALVREWSAARKKQSACCVDLGEECG